MNEEEVEKRIVKEKQETNLGEMNIHKKAYESLFKYSGQLSDSTKTQSNLLNEFKSLNSKYSIYRKKAIKLGADVSGLPKELNYMELQN